MRGQDLSGFRNRAGVLPMSSDNTNTTLPPVASEDSHNHTENKRLTPAGDMAVSVQGISKRYQIYDRPQDRLKQSIYPRLRRLVGKRPKQYCREFQALQDLSFAIKKGETVGIIGRNGSGKSTLLQIICGTLEPTHGTVETNGRIAALLELGSGFNPEFTGRENVYMNGAILGLNQKEIAARFDAIVGFADIGEFIEQPVKTYSSGMYVRLAFAVNIMVEPEIMIVDEALSVGDMNFQAKCMTALKRIQQKGTTIIFVSHDIGSVKSLCSRAFYLDAGKIVAAGPAAKVAERYIRDMREEMNEDVQETGSDAKEPSASSEKSSVKAGHKSESIFKQSDEFDKRIEQFRYGSGGVRVSFVELLDADNQPISSVEFNQEVKISIHFYSELAGEISPNYYIMDDKKNLILGAGPRQFDYELCPVLPGQRYIAIYTTNLPLHEGNYSLQVQLTKPAVINTSAEFLDVVDDVIVFNVQPRVPFRLWTKVLLPNSFEVIEI